MISLLTVGRFVNGALAQQRKNSLQMSCLLEEEKDQFTGWHLRALLGQREKHKLLMGRTSVLNEDIDLLPCGMALVLWNIKLFSCGSSQTSPWKGKVALKQ